MLGKIQITSILPALSLTATEIHQAVILDSAADSLVATPAGTQNSALTLTSKLNRITVVANDNDAVKLPRSTSGFTLQVRNDGAHALAVFPSTGDQINALGTNNAFTLASGTATTTFRCYTTGTWVTG